jgi:predicted dehydrogenase
VPRAQADKIRVGIVGLSAERGWGAEAHLPALAALPEFEVTAVATRGRATAEAAAKKYGIPHAFGSADELAASDAVDMVVIAVRTPAHHDLAETFARAGKHIYCEWPLGVSAEQAEQTLAAVQSAGVHHMIGLQGFQAPAALAVGSLIQSGAIGKVCATSFIGSGGPLGPVTRAALSYAADDKSGTSILTVHAGHWLATLDTVLQPLTSIAGLVATVNDEVVLEGSGERLRVTAPDQVVFVGECADKSVISFAAQSGVAKAAHNFELRVIGTDGTIVITPGRSQLIGSTGERPHDSFHFTDWNVLLAPSSGGTEILDLRSTARAGLPLSIPDGKVLNVAHSYRRFGEAIRTGSRVQPDFSTAVRYHRLLNRLQAASLSGQKQDVADLLISRQGTR